MNKTKRKESYNIDKIAAIYLWTVFIASELFAFFGLHLVYHGGINNWERFGVGFLLFILGAKFWFIILYAFAGIFESMIYPLFKNNKQVKRKLK